MRGMRAFARGWLLLGASLVVSACAARNPGTTHPALGDRYVTSGASNATDARSQPAKLRRREMTWDEYYSDVMQRLRRRGGMVIWINPPTPVPMPTRPQL